MILLGVSRALTDMVLEATAKEVEDIITAEEDVSAHEIGEKAIAIGALTEMDVRMRSAI